MVDANNSTFWTTGSSTNSGGNWVAFDFGSNKTIIEVKLRVRGDTFREDPRSLKLQTSPDGSTWTDVWAYGFDTGAMLVWDAGEIRTFTKF
jgi:hypothetical protein